MDKQLQRLNDILKILEKGEVGYEESLKLYEEAANISKDCLKQIDSEKGKIQKIKKDVEKYILEDFEI